jgi:hypothetical protein
MKFYKTVAMYGCKTEGITSRGKITWQAAEMRFFRSVVGITR